MDEARYRVVERRLFDAAGIEPVERWIDLDRVGGRARVLEVGVGAPALFLAGGPMAAATWAFVAAAAATGGVRCLLLDRPGTGLSGPRPSVPTPSTLPGYVADLSVDVLDALGVERAALVGSSFGGYSALRTAIAHPDRVEHLVLAGCPAFVPGWRQPAFFSVLRAPLLGRLVLALPANRTGALMSLRQLGHAASLRAGAVPDAMVEWTVAWQRHTDTMRNDAAMIRSCGTWRRGFDPALDLGDDELSAIAAPCRIVIGTADPVGDHTVAADLADRLPRAVVDVVEGAGHLPWLEDPRRVASAVGAGAGSRGPRTARRGS